MNENRRRGNSQAKEIWRRFKKNKLAIVGLVVISIFILVAIFADFIVPYEAGIAQNAKLRLQPPSFRFPFGTDEYGRNMFSRVVHGARISLAIGFSVTLVSVVIGAVIGAASAYYGGVIDNIVMRICDVFTCIPGILLMLALVAALGTSTVNLFVAITISSVPGYVRYIRSLVLTIAGQEYVEAAHSYGASDIRLIVKYILPNAFGPIIINTTMAIGGMILAASGLSYIGMGVQPPVPEWGAMLSNAGSFIRKAPYLLYFPGCAIMIAALSLNLVGDGLRDAFDPRLKN